MKRASSILISILLFLFASTAMAVDSGSISLGLSGGALLSHPYHASETLFDETPAYPLDLDFELSFVQTHSFELMFTAGLNYVHRHFDERAILYYDPVYYDGGDIDWTESRVRAGLRVSILPDPNRARLLLGAGVTQSNRSYPSDGARPGSYGTDPDIAVGPYGEIGLGYKLMRHFEIYGRFEWVFVSSQDRTTSDLHAASYDNGVLNIIPVAPDNTGIRSLNFGVRFLFR